MISVCLFNVILVLFFIENGIEIVYKTVDVYCKRFASPKTVISN